jgi:hypothetical protein
MYDECEMNESLFTVKKIAAFAAFDDLCIAATINAHTLPATSIYDVYATLPNPQEVLRWTLHSDSVG